MAGVLDRINTALDRLPDRDRRALAALALFLVLTACWWFITESLRYRANALKEFNSVTGLVWWVDSMTEKVKQAPAQADVGRSLLDIVSADDAGMHIVFTRVQPEGDDVLRGWMENTRFNALMVWLAALETKHGVTVQQLAVEPAGTEGYVNVRVTLQRAK